MMIMNLINDYESHKFYIRPKYANYAKFFYILFYDILLIS